MGELSQETELVVIGGGPGGYAAAFRAADLGMEVSLVEMGERPGGVCLFRGCIPSKTLLHLTELLYDARLAEAMGIAFGAPRIDLAAVRRWKEGVVDQLAEGLLSLTRQRGVQFIRGRAAFDGPRSVRLTDSEIRHITFKSAIIATGSDPIFFPDMEKTSLQRIMTSTEALELLDIPPRLLVIGGGYVGLELGSVYAALGSRVTLVELGDHLLPGVDRELVKLLEPRLRESFEGMYLKTRVASMVEEEERVRVLLQSEAGEKADAFDRVLVAIGRKPNSSDLGLDKVAIVTDTAGFIKVDERLRTANPAIFAIGDVVGGAMLAHKAMREGKVAAEVIAGLPSAFDPRALPAVVYTDPQVAWTGLTEAQTRTGERKVMIRRFPWKISGRAATMGLDGGLTKMIIDADTTRVLGVGIVGRGAEALIAEAVLAIEMGALAEDIALSIHPHPTLSETESEVAEIFLGSATHVISRKG
jgi:dihydrolipoamide dehydrogenase